MRYACPVCGTSIDTFTPLGGQVTCQSNHMPAVFEPDDDLAREYEAAVAARDEAVP